MIAERAWSRPSVRSGVLFFVFVTLLLLLVVAGAPSAFAAECTDCHSTQWHLAPADDCSVCHPYGTGPLNQRPSYYGDHEQGEDCLWCHDDWESPWPSNGGHYSVPFLTGHVNITGVDSVGRTYSCEDCHNPSRPLIPGHEASPAHPGGLAGASADCADCHEDDLVDAHSGDCLGCHASTDPDVVAAIASGNSTCDSCHDIDAAHESLHETTIPAGCTGAGCHTGTNLIPLHPDCATCHASADPNVSGAIASGDLDCATCHPATDHDALHETTVPAGCTGAGCHTGTNLIPMHPDCATCHASSDPNVSGAIASGDLDCATCHPATDHDALHETTVPAGCTGAGCHTGTNLIPMHPDCATCHASADPNVSGAIASGDLDCATCHPSTDHDALHDASGTGSPCLECHESNLLVAHSGGCASCHDSTNPVVIGAIAAGDLSCGTCHPGGHFQGASLNRYLTWIEAQEVMERNGVDPALRATPHGGYVVNTTKCAVCHSVHRADTDGTIGVGAYWKLTPGGQACVACHTPSGSNPVSTALVEWPSTYEDGGPHSSFNCLNACHAGVHGANQSEYGAVAAWNLTARNDAAIAAAFAAGNEASPLGNANSGSVVSGGGPHPDDYYADFGDAEFRANAIGANDAYGGNQQKAVMRAMATGYTCGASGCHSSSQFAVNAAGYAEMRASDPRASTTLDVGMTGHATNSIRGCDPCHASRDSKCAGCHDMIGKATNSSAFPHANRKITVFETDAAGETVEKSVRSGNLWMLTGDATLRDALGNPSATGTASPERRVVEDSAGFHEGNAGNINDGTCIKCHGLRYFGPSYFTHSSTADFTRK